MLSLLLATLGQTFFLLIIRHGQRSSRNLLAIAAVNYLTCAAAFAIAVLAGKSFQPSPPTITIGLLGGFSYALPLYMLIKVMRLRGVSFSASLARLSVLIPILISIFLWAERPNLYQASGILLALVSLALLSIQPGSNRIRLRDLPFPIAVFFAVGSCPLIVKAFQETGLTEQDAPFFLILFCTAFFISTIVWLSYPNRFSSAGFFWGFVLGLSNTMANKFLLQALEDLPGVIVFPVVSAFSLVLTVLFATLVWREKLHRPALCGIALAVVAIALVNIR